MKPIRFLLPVILVLISVPLCGQSPPVSYLGIYADETRTAWCASGSPSYDIDMWVFAVLSEGGLREYNFDISFPPNVVVASMVLNLDSSIPIICLPGYCTTPPGLYGAFDLCVPARFSPVWLVHATLSVVSSDPGIVEIVSTAGNRFYPPTLSTTTCGGGAESPIILSKLFVNYAPTAPECSGLAVNPASWGAIKALYR
jgi:hypothetical protein